MVTCTRIKVPDAAEASKEAKIQVIINNLEDVVTRNGKKEATCRRAGRASLFTTMSEEAQRGKQSILEREMAGELICLASDKSGKLAVMTLAIKSLSICNLNFSHFFKKDTYNTKKIRYSVKTKSPLLSPL